MPSKTSELRPWDHFGRRQLSSLYGLFVVTTLMFDGRESSEILQLAADTAPTLGPFAVEAAFDGTDGGLHRSSPRASPDLGLDARVQGLGGADSEMSSPDGGWRWALFTRANGTAVTGCLVVRSTAAPTSDELFLLKALAQPTGAALANAALIRRERKLLADLRRSAAERAEAIDKLSATVSRLEYQQRVHELLGAVPASGTGEPGIAAALHRLTGIPATIEDPFGNLRAAAGVDAGGAGWPSGGHREAALREASATGAPIRGGPRLISLVRPRGDLLGVLRLLDPDHQAGPDEVFALEYATTILTVELAHQRSLAEMELRLRGDLVDDLLSGTDEDSALARAQAIGHDLHGPHHVWVVHWPGPHSDDAVLAAITQVLRRLQLSALSARHAGLAVMIIPGRPDAESLFGRLSEQLGSADGAVGVGGLSSSPAELPRSFSEARRALQIRRQSRSPRGVTAFDQLGIYRILDTGESRADVETFVREWLGPLLDYDTQRHSDLVHTLSLYLECGGSYDATAGALIIHRSTLRYRLSRIREILHADLAAVDTRLNLHVATRAWQVLEGTAVR